MGAGLSFLGGLGQLRRAVPHESHAKSVAAHFIAAQSGLAVLVLAVAPLVVNARTPRPVGRGRPSTAGLNALVVRAEGSSSGYSRDLFPHWISQGDNCNTHEVVLRRDGSNVQVGSACYPTSGSWYSEFDGQTRTSAADVSIDHIVALAEAWRSGASSWTTSRRQSFANDLTGPQLIAVTTEVNYSKSDKDPAEWVPPLASKRYAYSKMWIHTKYRWGRTVDSAEEAARMRSRMAAVP